MNTILVSVGIAIGVTILLLSIVVYINNKSEEYECDRIRQRILWILQDDHHTPSTNYSLMTESIGTYAVSIYDPIYAETIKLFNSGISSSPTMNHKQFVDGKPQLNNADSYVDRLLRFKILNQKDWDNWKLRQPKSPFTYIGTADSLLN